MLRHRRAALLAALGAASVVWVLGCGAAGGPVALLAMALAASLGLAGCLGAFAAGGDGPGGAGDPAADGGAEADAGRDDDGGTTADAGFGDVDAGELPPPQDTDNDGIYDDADNCPLVANPDQLDIDGDGYGDVCDLASFLTPCCGPPDCDLDSDGDGLPDILDVCPWVPNGEAANADEDGDGLGDPCDDTGDFDQDDVPDAEDNCPRVVNPDQADQDMPGAEPDGVGDACDLCPGTEAPPACAPQCCYDADGDGVPGGHGPLAHDCPTPIPAPGSDNCPWWPNPDQADGDEDGVGDACDNCPDHPNWLQRDVDGDGRGDACTRGQQAQRPPTPARPSRWLATDRLHERARVLTTLAAKCPLPTALLSLVNDRGAG